MKKLNFLGIGPRMAVILLPWLAVTIILSIYKKSLFLFSAADTQIILISGIILMTAGLIFYFFTVRFLLQGLKSTKLMTTGPYSLCQNPLYSSLLLFIIPALALLLNSWLVLTSSVAGYILFKIYINNEYEELDKFFGEDYRIYRNRTPEFFPLPGKKRIRNS